MVNPEAVRQHATSQRARIAALCHAERRNLPRHVRGASLRELVARLLIQYRHWIDGNREHAYSPAGEPLIQTMQSGWHLMNAR